MPRREKMLLCAGAVFLVLLFLMSSTDLIIKERAVQIDSISVIVSEDTDDYYQNFRKGMEKAATDLRSDVRLITLYDRKDQDQQAPHDGGGQRTHQDRDLAAVDQIGVGEGQRIDEQRHREPDAAQTAHGQQHAPRRPLGQLRKTRPHGSPAGKEDAQRLAEDKTEEDAHAD